MNRLNRSHGNRGGWELIVLIVVIIIPKIHRIMSSHYHYQWFKGAIGSGLYEFGLNFQQQQIIITHNDFIASDL